MPTLTRLLQAGVACARIDLSWGTKQYHARSLANLQEAMQQTRRLCRCACMHACGAGLCFASLLPPARQCLS